MAHVVVAENGTIFILTTVADIEPRTKLGEIYCLQGKDGKLEALKSPKGFVGQALSGVIDEESRIFAATHQHCNAVSVWNLDTHALVASVPIPDSPRGISVNPATKSLLVSNLSGKLFEVDYRGGVLVLAEARDGVVGNNSHMVLLLAS
jgi:DNA-binding beta-propeller fold protein YncE